MRYKCKNVGMAKFAYDNYCFQINYVFYIHMYFSYKCLQSYLMVHVP